MSLRVERSETFAERSRSRQRLRRRSVAITKSLGLLLFSFPTGRYANGDEDSERERNDKYSTGHDITPETQIMQWIIQGLGLIATVGVTVYVTKIAKIALAQSVVMEVGNNERKEF